VPQTEPRQVQFIEIYAVVARVLGLLLCQCKEACNLTKIENDFEMLCVAFFHHRIINKQSQQRGSSVATKHRHHIK
jgi:hypothetical protein